MNPVIPEPAANASIIDWAKPVTRALTALADKRGAAARNERDRALPKLRPWEIHFFPAAANGNGAWGVYLPAGSLNVAGEEVTPTDGTGTTLAAAGAAYPGYYIIPVASGTSPSAFWLHVYTSEGTGGTSYRATVGASATANAGSGEETLTSIRLCSIASSGAITQLIVGAIALGGGGDSGGGGSGGGEYPTVDDPKTMVTAVSMVPTSSSATGYVSGHEGYIKVEKGNLKINAAGVINIGDSTTQYLETKPLSDLVVSNALISPTQ
jgi:hypothetical protein